MSATWRQLQRLKEQATTTTTEYRIEISTRLLFDWQEQQIIEAARAGSYAISKIHNGYTLAITKLTEQQATTIRDGLAEFGIHCSIGRGDIK